MKLAPGIEALGLGIHIPEHKAVVFADLHLGIEESMRRGGVLVPRQHFKDVLHRIGRILKRTKGVKTVILNGDLKHEFGRINDQEWREVKRLFDVFAKDGKEVIIVKGNHDVMLKPIADDRNIKVVDEFVMGDILVSHGDSKPKDLKGIKTVIIGHEHPTVFLRERAKAEKFKCFLVTSYRSKTLIVQPSFGPLTQGIDILRGELLSPLLGSNVRRGKVFVVDEESDAVLDFGKVSDLAR
jgi:putative SbcD/Mre11-related phosphoesterase